MAQEMESVCHHWCPMRVKHWGTGTRCSLFWEAQEGGGQDEARQETSQHWNPERIHAVHPGK